VKIKTITVVEKKDNDVVGLLCHHKKGDVREIKVYSIDFCCDMMKEAREKDFVAWGEDESYLNKVNSLTIVRTSCYPSGTVMDHLEIKYCPFCGERIKVENVETIED
jgi:hypothetical protein